MAQIAGHTGAFDKWDLGSTYGYKSKDRVAEVLRLAPTFAEATEGRQDKFMNGAWRYYPGFCFGLDLGCCRRRSR